MDTLDSTPEQPATPQTDNIAVTEEAFVAPIKYAGFWIRIGAMLLDGLCMLPLTLFTFFNILSIKSLPIAIITPFIYLAYKVLLEYKYGATLGKMICKIRVVNIQHQPITLTESLVRNLPIILSTLLSIATSYITFTSEGFADITSFIEYGTYTATLTLVTLFNRLFGGLYIADGICLIANSKKQALHDTIAGTYVIEIQ